MTALALVFMFITPLLPVTIYMCTSFAGFCVAIVCHEFGWRYGAAVWAAVSFLAFLLIPDKEAVIIFMLLFGEYPVLKNGVEKGKNRIAKKKFFKTVIKLVSVNFFCIVYFFAATYLIGVPKEAFEVGGVYLPWVFLILGNILFILYDAALNNVCILFSKYLRKAFGAR